MFIPNLKLAFRNLYNQGLSTIINTVGLLVGMTAAVFILLFILNELSFDKHHHYINRIYRVTQYNHTHKWMMATTPFPLAEILMQESPAIEKATVLERISHLMIRKDREWIKEENMYSCSPELFDIFTFPLLSGDSRRLSEPNTVVLSEMSTDKYFGIDDPVGESIEIKLSDTIILLEVVGVMKDPPENLSFRPEMVVSAELGLLSMSKNLITTGGPPPSLEEIAQDWKYNFFTTYLLLREGSDTTQVHAAFRSLEENYYSDEQKFSFHIQPLRDIYLNSDHLINSRNLSGDRQVIYIFTGVGLLIILISLLNYILLYSGQTISRVKEFGMRRIAGAAGKNLFNQVVSETILIAILVLPLCLVLIEILRPLVSEFLEKQMVIESRILWQYSLGVLLITLLVGLIPGISMISYVTRIQPLSVFRADKISGKGQVSRQFILVFCQFIVFNVLIISSLGIYKQVQYPMKKDLGFRWEDLIKVSINQQGSLADKFEEIKNDLLSVSAISAVSGAMFLPPTNSVMSINLNRLDGSAETVNLEALFVDKDFIETMGIKMIEGQSISEFSSGNERKVIINRKAMEQLGTERPIGEKIMGGEIVGIVDDFNTHTLHRDIPPTMIISSNHNLRDLIIRADRDRLAEVINYITISVKKFYPDSKPEIITIEEEMKNLYKKERITAATSGILSLTAIIIGAMGLFGISMYMIQRRRKEFAIRKVNGARSAYIIWLLARNYLILILSTLALAAPLSVYLLNRWLQNFVYRTPIAWWTFAVSGALILFIVSITVGIQVFRAARSNPIESLRYE